MSDALSMGLLGFGQGVLGTISNEYENINKEKTAIRGEERDQARTLEAERRAQDRQLDKESRDEARAIAAAQRLEEAQERSRIHQATLNNEHTFYSGEVAQQNQWENAAVDYDRAVSGQDASVERARQTGEIANEQYLERARAFQAEFNQLPGRYNKTNTFSATSTKDAVIAGTAASVTDNPNVTFEALTSKKQSGKDPKAIILNAESGKKIRRVFEDEEQLDFLKLQVLEGLSPSIGTATSALKTNNPADIDSYVSQVNSVVDSTTGRWQQYASQFDDKGNPRPEFTADIERKITVAAQEGGWSREEALNYMMGMEEDKLRKDLGEFSNSFPLLNKIQKSMLKRLYPEK